jgi:Holliday junction DNA helicase RuvA
MIGYLQGEVVASKDTFAIINVHGVGYKVYAAKDTLKTLTKDYPAALWIHTVVREDALDLYGFPREDELHFFELLRSVSGIGPKSALAILDIAAVETLRSAIASGNAGYLTSVSGIGKKTAEKIVLELRDKVGFTAEDVDALSNDAEALEALRTLGYTAAEAREALREVPNTISDSNARLREALRLLGSSKRT